MHYLGSHGAINWLFVLAILSLTQWLITGIYVYKYFPKLGTKISNDAFVGVEQYADNKKTRISFLHDYFYIYWNIYPIIFYGFFYYLDTSWDAYLAQIIMIGGEQAENYYKRFFTADYIRCLDTLAIVILGTIGLLATLGTQVKKQNIFKKCKNKVYWWDIRISKEIFWIRAIFLFFNIILVGFMAYIGIKVVLFIGSVLLQCNLLLNPFYPDGYGGLKVFMEITSIIFSIFLLHALIGVIGFFDHKDYRDKGLQFIGDVIYILYFFFGIILLASFVYRLDLLLGSIFKDVSFIFSHEEYQHFDNWKDLNISKIVKLSNDMTVYYEKIIRFNRFPLELSLFTGTFFTFILPLSLWFVVHILDGKHSNSNLNKN